MTCPASTECVQECCCLRPEGHSVGRERGKNILHCADVLYSGAVLGLTQKLKGMLNLFAKGPQTGYGISAICESFQHLLGLLQGLALWRVNEWNITIGLYFKALKSQPSISWV